MQYEHTAEGEWDEYDLLPPNAPIFELEHFARYGRKKVEIAQIFPLKTDGGWRYLIRLSNKEVKAVDEWELELIKNRNR
tara:strand:+ start:522 stop:758 length:237 start_codon:yes stop_codon:yes gene_type:complete